MSYNRAGSGRVHPAYRHTTNSRSYMPDHGASELAGAMPTSLGISHRYSLSSTDNGPGAAPAPRPDDQLQDLGQHSPRRPSDMRPRTAVERRLGGMPRKQPATTRDTRDIRSSLSATGIGHGSSPKGRRAQSASAGRSSFFGHGNRKVAASVYAGKAGPPDSSGRAGSKEPAGLVAEAARGGSRDLAPALAADAVQPGQPADGNPSTFLSQQLLAQSLLPQSLISRFAADRDILQPPPSQNAESSPNGPAAMDPVGMGPGTLEHDRAVRPDAGAAPGGAPSSSQEITIHVHDEIRKTSKDFGCDRQILVKEMKYFSTYLSDPTKVDGIEISVHCDVKVFEWLIRYIKARHSAESSTPVPTLNPKMVISILVSSEFLKMHTLVDECLDFCRQNINAIIKSASNLSCLTAGLLSRLCRLFTDEELDAIVDRKDRFMSKVYWKRLEHLFEDGGKGATLFQCVRCSRVMPSAHAHLSPCPGFGSVGYRGSMVYVHRVSLDWDINGYLAGLRLQGLSSKTIYWRVLGLFEHGYCQKCTSFFPLSEFRKCRQGAEQSAVPGSSAESYADHVIEPGMPGTTPMLAGLLRHVDAFDAPARPGADGGPTRCPNDGSRDPIGGTTVSHAAEASSIFWHEERASGVPDTADPMTHRPGTADQQPPAGTPETQKRLQSARPRGGGKLKKPQAPFFLLCPAELRNETLKVAFSTQKGPRPPPQKPDDDADAIKYFTDNARTKDEQRMVDMGGYLAAVRLPDDAVALSHKKRLRGHMGPFNMVDGREQALEAAMAQRAKAQAEADKTKRQGPRRGSSKTSIYSTM